jgi:hypothetical protein
MDAAWQDVPEGQLWEPDAALQHEMDELGRMTRNTLEARTVLVHGKGGHEDTLPLAFERLHDALSLYLLERHPGPDEYLLHPHGHPERPMNPATEHRWFKSACAAPAFLMPGACTTSAERLPMLSTRSRMTLC